MSFKKNVARIVALLTLTAFALPTVAQNFVEPRINVSDAGGVWSTMFIWAKHWGDRVIKDNRLVLKQKEANDPRRKPMVEEALAHQKLMAEVHRFYQARFGRVSYDDKNGEIKSFIQVARKWDSVDVFGLASNAAWQGDIFTRFIFGAGGPMLGNFSLQADVVAHEFTHAVIEYTSKLKYQGESGALNEHVADVMGEYFQHDLGRVAPGQDFLIGEGVLRGEAALKARALRDMLRPELGLKPQPARVADVDPKYGVDCEPSLENDNCGVHVLSGIPNKVVATVAKRHGWSLVAPIVYRVMTARLTELSTFVQYRDAMLDECRSTRGAQELCDDLQQAFEEAGVR